MGCIVIAVNSGGPLESVDHGKTGFLIPPKKELWAERIGLLMNAKEDEIQMYKNNSR